MSIGARNTPPPISTQGTTEGEAAGGAEPSRLRRRREQLRRDLDLAFDRDRAQARLSPQKVVEAIDNLRAAGVDQLGLITEEIKKNPIAVLGALMAKGSLKRVRERMDDSHYGGAVLRSAFKTKETNAPPASPVVPVRSPRDSQRD